MAEHLICNQAVDGSTPFTSSNNGGFPERPKGADCKSVVTDFGGPNPPSPTRKKHTFVYQTNVCFFQRNLPLRASEIATLWNICSANVKYSLTRMWANFISHCDRREQYFTIHKVNYFTFGVSRIFHLKKYWIYDIISSERRCYYGRFQTSWSIHRLCS